MLRAAALALLLVPGASAGERLTGAAALIPRSGAAGGGRASGGGFVLDSVVAEAAGSAAGTGVSLAAGYVPLSSWPGSVTALTALSKSSGTLELAWTAPGRDGSVGAVSSGRYRVDFSSDPAHPFAPTAYRVEVPTSVVPGAAQALTLTGLVPNTSYYARVWLGDAGGAFAEDGAPSEESTLAEAVVNPALAAVADTSVLITWTLPPGGAASFAASASTAQAAGGLAGQLLRATTGGLQVSLTVSGLDPDTTYFFQVASLNAQGQPAYTVLLATKTTTSVRPLPVFGLSAAQDAGGRAVRLTWSVAPFAQERGVLVVRSTSATAAVGDGSDLAAGDVRPDGGLVRSTGLLSGFTDSSLALNTSYFYHLFAFNQPLAYAVRVTTAVYLDLPPTGVGGLTASLSPDGLAFTAAWAGVESNSDGSAFGGVSPSTVELSGYELMRATGIVRPAWVAVASAPATASRLTDVLPDPAALYYYRVDSFDASGSRGTGMAMDSRGRLYALGGDGVTRLEVPAELAAQLRASGNSLGADLTLAVSSAPGAGDGTVLSAASFEARRLPDLAPVRDFRFSAPVELRLAYGAGAVGAGPAALGDSDVGLYWDNGARFIKLFGTVDPAAHTVAAQTALTGTFQVRALERSQGFSFNVSQLSNKAITPNGDGLNDAAVFVFDNPADSAFSGRIFDVEGGFVADMAPGPVRHSLQWDGKAGGRAVQGGVYVYQIQSEDKLYNGTVVVVR